MVLVTQPYEHTKIIELYNFKRCIDWHMYYTSK